MKDFYKAYKDIIISAILSIISIAIGTWLNLKNKYIDYILITFIPVVIPTLAILFNKPKFYMKCIYFKLRKKDIEFTYIIKFENLDLEGGSSYNGLIKEIERNYRNKGSDIKYISNQVGEFVANTRIKINMIDYIFHHDFETNTLLFTVESIVKYSSFFSIVERISQVILDVLSKSKNTGYESSISSLTIRFIDESSYNLSNPVFKNIYKEFKPSIAKLKYNENDTEITLTNDSIILKSSTLIDINKAIKTQFKFL